MMERERGGESGRERERERQRERDRETETETERQRQRQTERDRDIDCPPGLNCLVTGYMTSKDVYRHSGGSRQSNMLPSLQSGSDHTWTIPVNVLLWLDACPLKMYVRPRQVGSVGPGVGWGVGGEGGARRGTVLIACTTCRVAVTGCLTFENVRETEATERGGKRTVLLL